MSKILASIDPKEKIVVSITLSDDEELKELNTKYFNRAYTTDVLSFNIDEKMQDGSYYLGDVIVNKEQAKRQSEEYGNDLEHEVAALVEHGILHLLGVHHKDDDEKTVHGVTK